MPKKKLKTTDKAAKARLERKQVVAARDEKMRADGFVTVAAAAALTMMPRSNIYHWVVTGELARKKWGAAVYVSLSDLQRKVPAAFGSSPSERLGSRDASAVRS